MDFTALSANLRRVEEEIARVQAEEGVSSRVRVVAVTKGHPLEFVHAAAAVGMVEVGENRVQEALAKQDAAADLKVNWHLIGHLQSNKAKHIPGRFAMVHSVDSLRIAEALSRATARTSEVSGPLEVLIQVNVGKEPQKNGCEPETAGEIVSYVAESPSLTARGLMTMAPFGDDEGDQRKVFEALRLLRDKLEKEGFELPELSMGMSNDYRAAVAEGATILRLGTVLFGERAV
jgi:pyridoxal phosphate enzyme (YggS family)